MILYINLFIRFQHHYQTSHFCDCERLCEKDFNGHLVEDALKVKCLFI